MASQRKKQKPTIVLTGVNGRFGRMLARALHRDYRLIGVDPRGARRLPRDVTVHTIDLRRKKVEDIFRRNRIDAVIHLNPTPEWRGRTSEHRNIAVLGTQKLFSYCAKYQVPKAILLSSAALYGAHPDNDQFLTEAAPLMAGSGFATMRDLVEVDMFATSFFWKTPEVDTVILRPVHIVGDLNNGVSLYFKQKRVPTLLGFDPMVQVISPEDVVRSVVLALKPGLRGVFNIVGPAPLPLTQLIRMTGRRPFPVPEAVARSLIGIGFGVGATGVPSAQLDYLKYVCMVNSDAARDQLRFKARMSIEETMAPLERRRPG